VIIREKFDTVMGEIRERIKVEIIGAEAE